MIESRSEPLPASTATGFSAFLGRWRVLRRICDRRNASIQRFIGTALVETERFTEEGELDTGSGRLVSQRTYRLLRQGQRLSVRFANGADFISLGLDAHQTVIHHCGADAYHGQFFFRGADRWVELWRVTGPRKDYVSLTHYEREAGPCA